MITKTNFELSSWKLFWKDNFRRFTFNFDTCIKIRKSHKILGHDHTHCPEIYCHLNMKYIHDCTFFSDRSDFAVFQGSVYAPYLKGWLLESWLRHIQVFTQAVTVSSDTNWFVMCKGNNLENTCLAESVTRWLQWQSWTERVDFINIQGKISLTVSFGKKLFVQHW